VIFSLKQFIKYKLEILIYVYFVTYFKHKIIIKHSKYVVILHILFTSSLLSLVR